jgi:hypothetical protein
MTMEEVERLQELYEDGYAIDYMNKNGVWRRCCVWEPIEAYECGEPTRIAKKEQEDEVHIVDGASRKYYTEELV